MTEEPEFQTFECSNPDCRFRFANNLSVRELHVCPNCGGTLLPQGAPYKNSRFTSEAKNSKPSKKVEVLLDNLRSTLNVGSIFRSADGAGASFIYCCGTTPTPVHPKIAKTGLGAESFLPWQYHTNAFELVKQKRSQGVSIISIEATAQSTSLFSKSDETTISPILLIMGNEISGIDPEILAISDRVLHIPMAGQKDSLNVAVAFGIALYTLLY